MILQEWKLVKSELTGHVHASGYVHASDTHGDGDRILTSPVKKITKTEDACMIQTENSVYRCPFDENRTEDMKIFQEFGLEMP